MYVIFTYNIECISLRVDETITHVYVDQKSLPMHSLETYFLKF